MSILKTEMRNPESMHMDKMSTEEMASLVIRANYDAVKAAEGALFEISKAIDIIADAFKNGHRLIYVGAGTSGRLGILDASECPPTFGVSKDLVTAIIAGGRECMFSAGEGAEDGYDNGRKALRESKAKKGDVVVGISAAGNAAYVVGAIEEAKAIGCTTIGLCCNDGTAIVEAADISIITDTGAEVLTGSTRLKAGTAQKIVLNTLTTCAMTKTGKVYENMMINLAPSNIKLRERVIRIVSEILSVSNDEAESYLEENDWNILKSVSANSSKKGQM